MNNGDINKSILSAKNIVEKYCSYKPLKKHNILLNNWEYIWNHNEVNIGYDNDVCASMSIFRSYDNSNYEQKIKDLENINFTLNILENNEIEFWFNINQYFIQYNYYKFNIWFNEFNKDLPVLINKTHKFFSIILRNNTSISQTLILQSFNLIKL